MRIALLALIAGCAGTPKAESTKSDCEPGRCLADISRLIKEHRSEARACYDEGLKRAPSIKDGTIILNYEIDADGIATEVTQSTKDDQIQDVDVVICVTGVVQAITFPKSAKGTKTRGYHAFEFATHPKR